MAHKALYLRYRPGKFAEVKGQQHVVKAIQTAVRKGAVGHAYLLHGPRGTGKTTTARLLAKALNCTDLGDDGEPCGVCESCLSIEEGRSFDLHELDAASNNKVDDMRSLLERVSLVTPGRAKVYLLDEVHMLTTGAENALLKTLEEPPAHVTWVMATTEPHKVAQTIRSRCQVFELGLLNDDLMAEHVRYVAADAGLDVGEDVIDYVVKAGAGSVRDTLSALDGVAPGVEVTALDSSTDDLLSAVADRDPAAALAAVGDAIGRGRAPRTIGETALAGLRDAFLVKMGVPPPRLAEMARARAGELAERMAAADMTRALETLGRALVDMRQAPEPRVDIEVALVRLCQPAADASAGALDSLRRRVDQLEAQVRGFASAPAAGPAAPARPPPPVPPPVPPVPGHRPRRGAGRDGGPKSRGGPAMARQALGPRAGAADSPGRRSARPSAGPAAGPQARPPSDRTAASPPGAQPPPDSLQPETAKQVVTLAKRHLGLSKDFVVAKAKEMLPEGRRGQHSPEDLQRLWKALIAGSSSAPTGPDPQSSPASGSSAGGPPPVRGSSFSGSSVGGPSSAGAESAAVGEPAKSSEPIKDMEQELARLFPGTEFEDEAEGEAP